MTSLNLPLYLIQSCMGLQQWPPVSPMLAGVTPWIVPPFVFLIFSQMHERGHIRLNKH